MKAGKTLFVAATAAEAKAAAQHQSVSYPEPAPDHAWFSQAFRDVGAERRSHIERRGYDYAHDNEHRQGEMLSARPWGVIARLQLVQAVDQDEADTPQARQLLVEAAALIIAEIERRDRKALGI